MTEEREQPKAKPGPDEERLKIDGDWKDAMAKAIKKERPPDGWPDTDNDKNKKNDAPD